MDAKSDKLLSVVNEGQTKILIVVNVFEVEAKIPLFKSDDKE